MTSEEIDLLLFIKDYDKLFLSFYLIYSFTRNVVTMMGSEDKALASQNDLVNVEKKKVCFLF